MRPTPDKMRAFMAQLKKKMNLKSLVVTLAAIVVFTTTYLLILPAFTLDKEEAAEQGGIDIAVEQTVETAAEEASEEKAEEPAADQKEPAEAVTKAEEPAVKEEVKEETASPKQGTNSDKTKEDKEEVKLLGSRKELTAEKEKTDDFTISAVVDKDAKVPEDVFLEAKELTKDTEGFDYDKYYKDALKALQKDSDDVKGIKSIKFYDISLEAESQDESVEPEAAVNVKIAYDDGVKVDDADNVRIIHFAEQKNGEEKAEVLDNKENKVETTVNKKSEMTEASFDTEGFSVFAVVETKTITEQIITADGKTYEVTVTYGPEAKIPDGAKLNLTEFGKNSEEYQKVKALVVDNGEDASKNAEINNEDDALSVLDISILNSEGVEIEPKAAVNVKIEMKQLPDNADLDTLQSALVVQHFVEEDGNLTVKDVADTVNGTEGKLVVSENGAEATFDVESFSLFAFNWNGKNAHIIAHYVDQHGNDLVGKQKTDVSFGNNSTTILGTYQENIEVPLEDVEGGISTYEYVEARLNSVKGDVVTSFVAGNNTNNTVTFRNDNQTVHSYEAPFNADVYFVYKPTDYPDGGEGGTLEKPVTEKHLDPTLDENGNKDGTYTLSLSIKGTNDIHEDNVKANVVVIYDTSNSMNEATTARYTGYRATNGNYGQYGLVNDQYVQLYRRRTNGEYREVNSTENRDTVYYRTGSTFIVHKLGESEDELTRGRLKLLAEQISPHYIFNTLQCVRNLCESDPAKARDAIDTFSDYLRGNLESLTFEGLIAFKRELELTQAYLELEKLADRGAFEVEYRLETTDFVLPPLVLQPIVENAVRYGVGADSRKDKIVIETIDKPDRIIIRVMDEARGSGSLAQQQKKRKSIGLDNVHERLKKQCGGTLELEQTENMTTATIELPKAS